MISDPFVFPWNWFPGYIDFYLSDRIGESFIIEFGSADSILFQAFA
jgi:hypothetical protein